jgi:hypothetical protein
MDVMRSSLARRAAAAAASAALAVAIGAGSALAGGPPGLAFYVDGSWYRTVGTPTDLSGTGAPDSSYDVIYALGSGLANVAESKPGDTDYSGGRWQVLPVTWAMGVMPVQLTSAEAVLEAEADGLLTIGSDPVKQFVCPVIPLQGNAG